MSKDLRYLPFQPPFVVGDRLRWVEPVYAGPSLIGERGIVADVVGVAGDAAAPDFISFRLVTCNAYQDAAELPPSSIIKRRGRNLLRQRLARRVWPDEGLRDWSAPA